jgi:hypothetical protein
MNIGNILSVIKWKREKYVLYLVVHFEYLGRVSFDYHCEFLIYDIGQSFIYAPMFCRNLLPPISQGEVIRFVVK